MADAELMVTVEFVPDSGPILKATGEVDIQTSPILEEQLTKVLDEGLSSILVDFSGVTFLDSTGLSVLVAALKRCQSAGGEIRLLSPRPNVRRVLEVTGLTDAFQVETGDHEAPG